MLISLAYYYAFLTVDAYSAEPFFGTDEPTTSFMYFSMTTITTLGYGDLAAVTPLGRLLATSEAIVGQVYLVVFVALIVSLAAGRWQREND
nr:potassium channel family protein [Isoptericola halotolerans]